MNILVTGGTGFIGSHLLHRLTNSNHNVFLIKRSESDTWRINDIKKSIKAFDISSTNDLSALFAQIHFDIIIHLATAYIKHSGGIEDIEKMNEANIKFPSLLLELALKHKVKAFINTGTCFEYKLSKNKISEKQTLEPYNYYAATKLAFENILKYYVKNKGINALTLKLFYPYGEKDNKKIIPLMINSLINNQPLEITYGEQKLNYTFVEDIIDAYINAVTFVTSNKFSSYENINIGTNKTYAIKTIVKVLEKICKNKDMISLTRPYPENEIMYMTCDYTKAKKMLKWQPKTDIIDGLKKTYSYYVKNRL